MHRRKLLVALAAWPASAAFAHHGWSSFDQGRPLYLDGVARKVAWRNPHVEFDLEVMPDLKVPADLGKRALPAQSAAVDGARLLASARAPVRRDRTWRIELALDLARRSCSPTPSPRCAKLSPVRCSASTRTLTPSS